MIDGLLNRCGSVLSQRVLEERGLREQLQGLAGKVVEVRLLGPDLHLYALIEAEGIRLTRDSNVAGDISLRGTPLAVLRLLKQSRKGEFGVGEGVDVQGDLAILQRVQRLAAGLDFDIEDLLAERLGDTVAYGLSRAARRTLTVLSVTVRTFERNLREFALFESRAVPDREEVASFVDSVDELRSSVDRIEQRIARLRRSLNDA